MQCQTVAVNLGPDDPPRDGLHGNDVNWRVTQAAAHDQPPNGKWKGVGRNNRDGLRVISYDSETSAPVWETSRASALVVTLTASTERHCVVQSIANQYVV